jgi:hypothetical protein
MLGASALEAARALPQKFNAINKEVIKDMVATGQMLGEDIKNTWDLPEKMDQQTLEKIREQIRNNERMMRENIRRYRGG